MNSQVVAAIIAAVAAIIVAIITGCFSLKAKKVNGKKTDTTNNNNPLVIKGNEDTSISDSTIEGNVKIEQNKTLTIKNNKIKRQ